MLSRNITTDSTSGTVAADPDRSANTMTYCIDRYGYNLSNEEEKGSWNFDEAGVLNLFSSTSFGKGDFAHDQIPPQEDS